MPLHRNHDASRHTLWYRQIQLNKISKLRDHVISQYLSCPCDDSWSSRCPCYHFNVSILIRYNCWAHWREWSFARANIVCRCWWVTVQVGFSWRWKIIHLIVVNDSSLCRAISTTKSRIPTSVWLKEAPNHPLSENPPLWQVHPRASLIAGLRIHDVNGNCNDKWLQLISV